MCQMCFFESVGAARDNKWFCKLDVIPFYRHDNDQDAG